MIKYNPKKIESKWQKYWEKKKVFNVKEDPKKTKFYALIEFPYPSGAGLHVGHPRSYTALDILCRKKRMEGFIVLYPIGFDAFGLPTENFAIKTGQPPAKVTKTNIATFTRQLKSLGLGFDWSRVVDTTDPKYYKWTQWLFLQFFKHGLAYKKAMPINWCPKDKIGLANEEVVNGCCERCGAPVERRNKEQWMLAITKYADKLLAGLKNVDYIPQVRTQQENWIGRSEGALVKFPISNTKYQIEVFTTRPDTLFGATYVVVAPEHELFKNLEKQIQNLEEVKKYLQTSKKKSDLERTELQKEKIGVRLGGISAVNPVNNEKLPVFVADYVLGGYGTGAIMAVPAHDERDYAFAKKYDLPIKEVVKGGDIIKEAYTGNGVSVNSGFLNGLVTAEAVKKMISWLEEKNFGQKQVQYKLRDWVFSRQRYWGEPIPLVFCEHCAGKFQIPNSKFQNELNDGEKLNPGWFAIPESELPIELPKVKKYEPTDTGESPLAAITKWVNTKCPKCGGPAQRETDTMPNWAGSSWYFLRYCDPKNTKAFATLEKLKYWLPVDWYNGGMEHVVLHLLYSRFWNIFLHDIGLVPVSEPYQKRTSHGMILAKGGEKMSKSKGNVVNPDEMVKEFGADTLRTYIMFMGPFDQSVEWDTNGLVGVRRFLDRVWQMQTKVVIPAKAGIQQVAKQRLDSRFRGNDKIEVLLNQTIKKVGEDIEAMHYNTAVSALMILANELGAEEKISTAQYSAFLKLLSPFAPHIAEELWASLGNKKCLVQSEWPKFDPALIQNKEITLVVQINGKVRDNLTVPADIDEAKARELALKSPVIKKWLGGAEPKKVIYVKGRLVSIVI